MAINIISSKGRFDTLYDYKRQFNGPFDALTVFENKTISQLQSTGNYLYNGEFLANNEPNKDTKPYFVTIKNGVVTITEISLVGHTHNYADASHTHGISDLTGVASSNHNHDSKYATIGHTHAPSGASSSEISDLVNRVAKLESLIGFNVDGGVTVTPTVIPDTTTTGTSTATATPKPDTPDTPDTPEEPTTPTTTSKK